MCCCYVCGVNYQHCRMWFTEGHCHAHDRDKWWKAHRQYHGIDLVSNNAVIQVLDGDKQMYGEAKRWCLEMMVAFQRYREGDVRRDGIVDHHFKHVTDVASQAVRAVGQNLSSSNKPCSTLAILHALTVAIVLHTWRPSSVPENHHRWVQGTSGAYAAILDRLEKFWVVAFMYSNPTQAALELLNKHLHVLSKKAGRELVQDVDGFDTGPYTATGRTPLQHTILACQRGWQNPNVVSILQGDCRNVLQRELSILQRARLHVLERSHRWKEAYHYAIFHGHISKSLTYVVRAGYHKDVLSMVKKQRALARMGKCIAVCNELVAVNRDEHAWRLAMYCAFQSESLEGWVPGARAEASRLPYLNWLVRQLMNKMRWTSEGVRDCEHGEALLLTSCFHVHRHQDGGEAFSHIHVDVHGLLGRAEATVPRLGDNSGGPACGIGCLSKPRLASSTRKLHTFASLRGERFCSRVFCWFCWCAFHSARSIRVRSTASGTLSAYASPRAHP